MRALAGLQIKLKHHFYSELLSTVDTTESSGWFANTLKMPLLLRIAIYCRQHSPLRALVGLQIKLKHHFYSELLSTVDSIHHWQLWLGFQSLFLKHWNTFTNRIYVQGFDSIREGDEIKFEKLLRAIKSITLKYISTEIKVIWNSRCRIKNKSWFPLSELHNS